MAAQPQAATLHFSTKDTAAGRVDPKPLCVRLLQVEDNVDAAETIVMCLEAYGYCVTHAVTCAQAVKVGGEGGFDVVLTDLGLPDGSGSGIDLGRVLSRSMPVVALSGYGAPPDLESSAMAGFSGHTVKLAEPQTIHAVL